MLTMIGGLPYYDFDSRTSPEVLRHLKHQAFEAKVKGVATAFFAALSLALPIIAMHCISQNISFSAQTIVKLALCCPIIGFSALPLVMLATLSFHHFNAADHLTAQRILLTPE